jgi:hypothetical protein
VLLIICLIIGGALAFEILYIPGNEKMVEKLTEQGLTTCYVGADGAVLGEASLQLAVAGLLTTYDSTFPEITFTGVLYFKSPTEGDADPEIEGYLVLTDSIKSSVSLLINYYKEGDSTELFSEEGIHASLRGKAFFPRQPERRTCFEKDTVLSSTELSFCKTLQKILQVFCYLLIVKHRLVNKI